MTAVTAQRAAGAGMMLYGSNEHVSPNDGKLEVFTREGPTVLLGLKQQQLGPPSNKIGCQADHVSHGQAGI